MTQYPIPTLKRPRSTSTPPSPSSTSSPKRALSEDEFASSSDVGRPEGLLTPNMQANGGAGSSPLSRFDEGEQDEEGDLGEAWVKRTEDVHLHSDAVEEDVEEEKSLDTAALSQQYNELLGHVPPPFTPWASYYIIPTFLFNALKTFAQHDSATSKSDDSASHLKIDLSRLLKDPEGMELHVPQTSTSTDGRSTFTGYTKLERVWQVADGLVEGEDFMFVDEEGWDKLVDWYGPYNGPVLRCFAVPGDRLEMRPPIITVYLVRNSSGIPASSIEPPNPNSPAPIRLMFSIAGSLKTLLQLCKDAVSSHLTDVTAPTRFWTIDTSSSSTDAETLPALSALELPSTLLPSVAGHMLGASGDLTCAQAEILDGDTLAVEVGKLSPLGHTMWAVDINEQGKAVEKVSTAMLIPTAPPPLFSKPAMFGGPGKENAVASTSKSADGGMQTRSQTAASNPRKGKGLVGLVNLGNTCFMNSAVQCLSNTQELSEYFLSGVYDEELNEDNPLGMGGQVARAFGQTVEALWAAAGAHASFSPRTLKYTTSRFAPQFAGYGQHDTQEFIAFLLDGLHEDLNRIKKKPYIEKPDWKPGGGDKELAELGKECWEGYKKRNDSVIVDLFQGQLRSTLVCPECHKESITMDPFMYLTVPMPIAQMRQMKMTFIPRDPEKPPVQVRVLVPQNASFGQVKEKLGKLVGCSPSHLVSFDLWKGTVYSWWSDADHNSDAKDTDLAVYHELAVPISSTRKSTGTSGTDAMVTVPVYTCLEPEVSRSRYGGTGYSECTLQPFFISLSKADAANPVAVREAITRGYARFVIPEMRGQMWVPSGSSKAAIPGPTAEDEESVAEIHLDGDQTRVIEVPAGSQTSMDVDQPSPSANPSHPANGSSTSLNTLSSSKSGNLVPRGDLFKVHVADASTSEGSGSSMNVFKSKDPVIPLYKGSVSSASASWSTLENRRKPKKNMFAQIATGIKSIVSPTYGSEDEGSPPNSPAPAPLVVRPGEGIFVEWGGKHFYEYFNNSRVEEELDDPAIEKELAKKKEGKAISLEDCLDEFSKEETLGQDDLWYCPQCKKHQAATKKLEIYKVPDILVICIKRFGSSRRLSDKLDNLVNFPIDGLDLEDRIGERMVAKGMQLSEEGAAEYGMENGDDPMIYDLYAVDNHFGGMGGGHYTAFCRNKLDGEWYNYDDSRVSKANVEAVQSRAAYLLFYRRRTSRAIGGISRIKAEAASAAASPIPTAPSSPSLGPSRLSESTTLQQTETSDSSSISPPATSTSSDELPSYSATGSPSLSDNDNGNIDSDADESMSRGQYLRMEGRTSWGIKSDSTEGVRHPFASGERGTGLPSPPLSERESDA